MRSNLTLKQLLVCSSYLGNTTKKWNRFMNSFILSSYYNLCFINLKYTIFLFNKALNILRTIQLNDGLLVFYLPYNKLSTLYNLDINKLSSMNNFLFYSEWLPGYLTNWKIFKYQYPVGVFLLGKKSYIDICNEGFLSGTFTFGFVNNQIAPHVFQYPIPINSNSWQGLEFYINLIFFYLILVRQEELFSYYYQILLKIN